ncbi:hypothetical protein H9Y05_01840 [Crocinitomicaceae bacterium CZZ-1]|uniref:TraB/GumN family protein n=1 Tax=Taishania pollutisoli TaxID=2766479 RepID=A0A8J6PHU2_9FLAO|nr:hypothetical protein [Taishania pollutisoli]MBC9811205.1 hypothetical protein [Taishania pollutisoli]
MLNKIVIFVLFLSSKCLAQSIDSETNKNIFLIGENHFIKEKYDEIKAFTFDQLKQLKKGEKASFYFELPYTLNFAFHKIKEQGDTTVFYEWFHHLYQSKNEPPSYFWIDYRDMILALIEYADKKEIELELMGIDTELEFRRTAFILSQFDSKVGTTIDSLLNLDFISNDRLTRNILNNHIDKLLEIPHEEIELAILRTLKKSLMIDCTICVDRDLFMLSNFMKSYDSTVPLHFISLGLDHIVSKHDFSNASSLFTTKYKMDTISYQSFYELMDKDFKEKTWRVGILALNHKLKYANISKPVDLKTLMDEMERIYIEEQLLDNDIYRANLSKNKALINLSKQLDYIIIYKTSHYK